MLKRFDIFAVGVSVSALLLAACGDGGAPADAELEPGGLPAGETAPEGAPGALAGADVAPEPAEVAPYDPSQDYGEPHARADFEFAGEGSGTAWFFQAPEGVRVYVLVRGMDQGSHAMHIHETGDCSARDFVGTAGGHLGADAGQVLTDRPADFEAGALPDLKIRADGSGMLNAVLDTVTFTEDTERTWPLFDADGASIVIHRFATGELPAGQDNPAIACGEIFESDL